MRCRIHNTVAGLLLALALFTAAPFLGGGAAEASEGAPAEAFGAVSAETPDERGFRQETAVEEPGEAVPPAGDLSRSVSRMRALSAALAAALLLALLAGALVYQNRVSAPMKRLKEILAEAPEQSDDALREKIMAVGGVPGVSIRAVLEQSERLEREKSDAPKRTDGEASVLAQDALTTEVCRSVLPQELRQSRRTAGFGLAGEVYEAKKPNCTFFDYFFLDDDSLCFVIGQVPGHGISDALYMVIAQTTIRSRLRLGRSLTETLSDVNSQLYDYGKRQSVCALVGILDTKDGKVTYVNAAGPLPLLMRRGEGYEWLQSPVYAALGLNENVSYRQEELHLRQGDRLFLYTAGLALAENREGRLFREKEFRAALNRSRGKAKLPLDIVHFIRDEASAFCERQDDLPGYASMVLEYRRGTRDFTFCELPSDPNASSAATVFLRQACEDNGIPPKNCARLLVMVEELFAVCCRRRAKEDSLIRVECAVTPDRQIVNVHIAASLGGVNPLGSESGEQDQGIAAFIRSNAEQIHFEAGDETDGISIAYPTGLLPEGDAKPGEDFWNSAPRYSSGRKTHARKKSSARGELSVQGAGFPREELRAGEENETAGEPENKTLTIPLEGRLDALTSPDVEKRILSSLSGVRALVLDMKDVSYLSSSGLSMLLNAQKAMSGKGEVRLRGVSGNVREILETTGFVDIIHVETDAPDSEADSAGEMISTRKETETE